jgi:predicted AlkP superfamily pyrophosphatase or phosphodiesterase
LAFLYTAALDGLMHEHTKDSPLVDDKLAWYQAEARRILDTAAANYDEVRFALFSDHGMATIHTVVDLMPAVEALGLEEGRDYAAVHDSTMMRFWFLRDGVEERIRAALPDDENGRWVSKEQLEAYGTWWPDGRFGDAIYAFEPGVLLNPSHMGTVAPAGMHGYRPDHPDSNAALIANFTPNKPVEVITDLCGVMREMASWATS